MWAKPLIDEADRASALLRYRRWLGRLDDAADFKREIVAELRGKDLACWCRLDQPCHADVLLELANRRAED